MKKNNFQPVSNKELDSLLGKAFLDLDFEASENDKMLNAVADHAMHKETITAFFNKRLLGLLLLLLSFFICLSSFASFMGYFEMYDAKANAILPSLPMVKALSLNKTEHTPLPAPGLAIQKITVSPNFPETAVLNNKPKELPVRKSKSNLNSGAEKVTLPLTDTSHTQKVSSYDSIVRPFEPAQSDLAIQHFAKSKSAGTLTKSTSGTQTAQQKRTKKVEPVKQNDRVRYAVRKKKLFRGSGSRKKGKGAGPFSWFKNKRVRGR